MNVASVWERILRAVRFAMTDDLAHGKRYMRSWVHRGWTRKRKFNRAWYYGCTGPLIISVGIRRFVNESAIRQEPDAPLPPWLAFGFIPLDPEDGRRVLAQMMGALINDDQPAAMDVLTVHYQNHGLTGLIEVGEAAVEFITRSMQGDLGLRIDVKRSDDDWTLPDG